MVLYVIQQNEFVSLFCMLKNKTRDTQESVLKLNYRNKCRFFSLFLCFDLLFHNSHPFCTPTSSVLVTFMYVITDEALLQTIFLRDFI